MPVEKSSGAIIFRKENNEIFYLLIQYGLGHWDFSRGLIEKGEKLEETAKREIQEETGLIDLEFIPGFKETVKFFYKFEGKNIMKFATYFLVETKQREIKLSYEHNDFVWLPYEQALEKITYNNSKKVLTKAQEFLETKQPLPI